MPFHLLNSQVVRFFRFHFTESVYGSYYWRISPSRRDESCGGESTNFVVSLVQVTKSNATDRKMWSSISDNVIV